MKKGCFYLIINLIIVLILLGIMEVVSRIVLHKVYNREFDSSLIENQKYGTSDGLKTNATGTVWGKPFHTDSFGCRVNAKPFNPKKKKWLFIGDSVTEGVGVDDSSTFSSLVSANVDSINVLNYSLIGYSVTDYYSLLQSVLSDSSIERVTIFYCLNDVYGSRSAKQLPVMGKTNWMGKLNGFLQDKYATYKLLKLILFKNADRYYQYDSKFYETPGPFQQAIGALGDSKKLCAAKGVKMDMVILPYRSQLSGRDKDNRLPQRIVTEYCQKQGIPVADPLQYLEKQGKPADLYLFSDEIHLSEAGHKAIARFILSH